MPDTHYTITAGADDAGQRLDRFLAMRLPELSRSRVQSLIAQGQVTHAGTPVINAAHKIKPEQLFTITVPEAVPSHIEPQDIPLDIVYEDEHFLILNKPPGLTVHPAPGNWDSTLVNALLAHCGASLSGIGGVARPGIVHRIDKDTGGLLAVAKHDAAHLALSAQLAERTLKRTYAAMCWGVPASAQGTITGNIGRSVSNRQKMAVVPHGGKPAVTHYKIVNALSPRERGGVSRDEGVSTERSSEGRLPHPNPLPKGEGMFSLLECRLETGRTHQIRVHLTHIGHPLVGDPVYGASTESRLRAKAYHSLPETTRATLLGFKRQALHAKALELVHPATGKPMRFEAPLPEDMRGLLEVLGITL